MPTGTQASTTTRWSNGAAPIWSVAAALLAASGLASHAAEHAFERPCMGTLFRIVVHSERERAEVAPAAAAALAIAADLDARLSDYRADSEVGRFHRSPAGEPFPVSATSAEVLALASELAAHTGGAFDPARGALTWQWRKSRRDAALPDAETLAAALAASGLKRLDFDPAGRTLTRADPLTRLDFGGIAKGYAADAMLAELQRRGFPRSSIAAGGDVRCGDPPPDRAAWRVTLRPNGTAPEVRGIVISLANGAVSTSGSVEQGVEIEGVRYSHIIDPATGLGMTSARAASVIAPTAAESDALATALCLLGAKGLETISRRPGCSGVLFAGDGRPSARSPGFPHSLQEGR